MSILTKDAKFYADSVYASCLAIEFYLKSVMNRVPNSKKYEFTHDVINLYNEINKKYPSSKDLSLIMRRCRKYNNESRYPYNGVEIFTSEFAEEFLSYVKLVKEYVDNECKPTIDDLKNKFK